MRSNPITCEGCEKEFMTRTAEWSNHYEECHKPAKEERSRMYAAERLAWFTTAQKSTLMEEGGFTSEGADAIIKVIRNMRGGDGD